MQEQNPVKTWTKMDLSEYEEEIEQEAEQESPPPPYPAEINYRVNSRSYNEHNGFKCLQLQKYLI